MLFFLMCITQHNETLFYLYKINWNKFQNYHTVMTIPHIHIEIKKTIGLFFHCCTLNLFHSHPVTKGYMLLLPLLSCRMTMSFSWQEFSLQGKMQAWKGISLVGIHGINRKGIWAAAKLGKVEITVQRKITDQSLHGYDNSFADTSSVSHRVFSCHRTSQAKFNGALTVAMGPLHESWGTARSAKVISQIEEKKLFLY